MLICMKCGGTEYRTYRDFPYDKGIKKCLKCGCEMIDPRNVMERIGCDHSSSKYKQINKHQEECQRCGNVRVIR